MSTQVLKAGSAANTINLVNNEDGTFSITKGESSPTTLVTLGSQGTWPTAQRGSVLTDNDLSFDMNAGNNFYCTPTGSGTLAFTNITAGQSGNIAFNNTANYSISKSSYIFCDSSLLVRLSTTGLYLISYYSPDGTNVLISTTGALS